MRNQSLEIPEHLWPEFNTINNELRVASEQLNEANFRHQRAVLARLAMEGDITDEELQLAKEQASTAGARYVAAIAARIDITEKINFAVHGRS